MTTPTEDPGPLDEVGQALATLRAAVLQFLADNPLDEEHGQVDKDKLHTQLVERIQQTPDVSAQAAAAHAALQAKPTPQAHKPAAPDSGATAAHQPAARQAADDKKSTAAIKVDHLKLPEVGGGYPNYPSGHHHHADDQQLIAWINEAFSELRAAGVAGESLNVQVVLEIIYHESGGDPNSVNDWDSNAVKGDPSRGLMQTIGTTFGQYKLPGHDDIFGPVDNIIAGVRYALHRYGSLNKVPGVKAVAKGEKYVGY